MPWIKFGVPRMIEIKEWWQVPEEYGVPGTDWYTVIVDQNGDAWKIEPTTRPVKNGVGYKSSRPSLTLRG